MAAMPEITPRKSKESKRLGKAGGVGVAGGGGAGAGVPVINPR